MATDDRGSTRTHQERDTGPPVSREYRGDGIQRHVPPPTITPPPDEPPPPPPRPRTETRSEDFDACGDNHVRDGQTFYCERHLGHMGPHRALIWWPA